MANTIMCNRDCKKTDSFDGGGGGGEVAAPFPPPSPPPAPLRSCSKIEFVSNCGDADEIPAGRPPDTLPNGIVDRLPNDGNESPPDCPNVDVSKFLFCMASNRM